MKINLDNPTEEVRIEIIPLIDVIFCILTFFLLAALQLTRQQAINVNLPQAKSGVPQMRDMLIVSLDDFGQVYLEKQVMMSKDQLSEGLKNYRATNPNGLMVLYAAKTSSYNDVIQVLDLLRSIGGDRVALATLPSASPQDPSSNNQGTQSPSLTPYSGTNPVPPNPSGIPNPSQPQLPINPGIPFNGQGINPNSPSNFPLSPNVPNPGATLAPGTSPPNPQR
ncbi:Biopolymer transport protein ExbD/TolR [Crinalium epipsammum PCC 9333]|uniref:Biopolymer transport protein ExbD/TolR n=1 Tax=Crinalium epipsammum PCC 9333 TaxID=1173022 RepID=K9VXY2_9CYAN|nr:biopolymer transporter ExbD [Crinalium epipsammum]AFZ12005.1 Biopolymer transport protein ExbD/TolR [Crinalium epipsammum PCC 9333]